MKISEQEKIEKIIKKLEKIAVKGEKIVHKARGQAKIGGLKKLKEYLVKCIESERGKKIDNYLERQGKPNLRSEWSKIESIFEDC